MRRILPALSVAALLGVATPAGALAPRDTADAGAPGSYSVGVFNPLTYQWLDNLALRVHPLLFFVSPNLVAEVAHGSLGPVRLQGEYGLSLPTPVMRLSKGYLFASGRDIGWHVVPRAGLVASSGAPELHVLTGRVDAAFGFTLGADDTTPMSGVAPLELLFAPVLSTYRAHLGVAYDRALLPWLRARGAVDGYLHGKNPSPFTLRASLGVDLAVGEASRFTVGVMWWNSDTGAIDEETHARVRSNDFLPTLDFIWGG